MKEATNQRNGPRRNHSARATETNQEMEYSNHHEAGTRQDSVWRKLIRDPRVSHGAFRLWHYLRDRANDEGKCWPEQRTIAREMHCKCHSLLGWIEKLEAGGYLRTESKGQNHHTVYTVLDGSGRPFSRDAQKGNTRRCPNGHVASPKRATPRASQEGNVSKPSEVKSGSKRSVVPQFEPVASGLYRREYGEMLAYAKTNIKAARSDPELRERVLQPGAVELCDFLRREAKEQPEKAAENSQRVAACEANVASWTAGVPTAEGRTVIEAWRERIREIEHAMNGRIQ